MPSVEILKAFLELEEDEDSQKMIEQSGFKSPITAEGLTLVEYSCFHCGFRWWVEETKERLELPRHLTHCRHGKEFSRQTGYTTHIRLCDF